MIRLNLKPSIIKKLSFNKKKKSLEIEFKENIKTSKCINIPLSILQEYVDSLSRNEIFTDKNEYQSTLKIVHSNFKAS
ncbi:hypothetical protein [Algibacter luteus]|uniref:hypothetical protein n=1 Tax=Algibacter luteus TaxID=1178825 RepID=UPI0025973B41|nr:hypothetical protein [Algibacter luteus]WJJ98250.1 hypothetical protein O5O44_07610 [Algibacter luteus]